MARKPLQFTRIVPLVVEACQECGGHDLQLVAQDSVTQIEVAPRLPPEIVRYQTPHYECRECGARSKAQPAGGPDMPGYGPHLKAEVVQLRVLDRLPIRKVKASLARAGVPISDATVWKLLRCAAGRLNGEYARIALRIRVAPVVWADETSFRVDGKNWWLWVFTTPTDTLLVLRPSRAADVLQEILGTEFGGVLVCDGWKPYAGFGRARQRCWAHLLRVAEKAPGRLGVTFHAELLEFFRRVRDALKLTKTHRGRRCIMAWAAPELEALRQRWRGRGSLELRRACTYFDNGFPNWLTFLQHEGVEPTNNRGERALRESIVIRKIIGTLRNETGAEVFTCLASTVATWQQRRQDVHAKLIAALQ